MEYNPSWSAEEKGRWGEAVVRELLKQHNWYVRNENTGQNDGAPLFEGVEDAIITPDLRAFKQRADVWVEVKTKSDYEVYGIEGNEPRHGIDAKNWDDYERVDQKHSVPVWLFIVEGLNDILCYQSVSELEVAQRLPRVDSGGKYDCDMVFFRRRHFHRHPFSVETDSVKFGQKRLDSFTNEESEFERLFEHGLKKVVGGGQAGLTDF